jgi:hypothetical protein
MDDLLISVAQFVGSVAGDELSDLEFSLVVDRIVADLMTPAAADALAS